MIKALAFELGIELSQWMDTSGMALPAFREKTEYLGEGHKQRYADGLLFFLLAAVAVGLYTRDYSMELFWFGGSELIQSESRRLHNNKRRYNK